MSDKRGLIWLDGKFVPWAKANVHVLTHTLHYGLGVFEGIRAYKCDDGKTAIFLLDEHIKRLYNSCHIAGIKIPYTKKVIKSAIIQLINKNKLDEAYIRPLVFIGDGSFGVHPKNNPIRLAIAAWPWGAYLGDDGVNKGIRTKVSSFTRMGVNSFMTKAKISGNYVNSIFAKVEATRLGFDEALLLDSEGYLAEGSGENIFIVRNKIIKTPPLTSILEGLTRNCIIQIAKDKKYTVTEERFTRDELYIADEVFLTGTAAEVTPIREVDYRVIGSGKPGRVTKDLQSTFFDTVRGKNEKYSGWIEYV
ncbi:MAG: branched-chain amino acid transaminase [Thermodesulfobacteriota bacterium]